MGRLPTSGYCRTCRRRRVKCDRERPACQRCLRSGHTCDGYDLVHIRMAQFGQQSASEQPAAPSSSSQLHEETRTHSDGEASEQRVLPNISGSIPSSVLPFWDFFVSSYHCAHWWKATLLRGLMERPSSISYKITEALLFGYYAAAHDDRKLFATSRSLYGDCLRMVSEALTRETQANMAGLTLPIMLLSMYPYVLDKSPELEHHLGLETVVSHCDPASFQDPDMVNLFRDSRSMLVCQAFVKKRRTFLEREEWKVVPFARTRKSHMDRMYDIFTEIPGLFEDLQSLKTAHDGPAGRRLSSKVLEKLQQDLDTWRRSWDLENASTTAAMASLPALSSTDAVRSALLSCRSRSGPTVAFDSFYQAFELLSYEAAVISVSRLRERLSNHSQTSHGRTPPSSGPARLSMKKATELFQQCIYLAREVEHIQSINFHALLSVAVVYCALTETGGLANIMAESFGEFCGSTASLYEFEAFRVWEV